MPEILFCTNTKKLGDECCPNHHGKVAHYTQILLDGCCTIPEAKPDMEKITSITHDIDFKKAITVESQEVECGSQVHEGKKVLVAGIFTLGIAYISTSDDQKVHYFESKLPFLAIILWHRDCRGQLFPAEFSLAKYQVHVCIEDKEVCQVDQRTIETEIVLMVWLEPKPCIHKQQRGKESEPSGPRCLS